MVNTPMPTPKAMPRDYAISGGLAPKVYGENGFNRLHFQNV
jgi:hypothetical protein